MPTHERLIKRSFRLSSRTLELLDERAVARGMSSDALADQLLGETVRVDSHPLVTFLAGGSGRRRPALLGTRLYVEDVISSLRGESGSLEAAAEYLGIDVRLVQAALAYYADFADEVDHSLEAAVVVAREVRSRSVQ